MAMDEDLRREFGFSLRECPWCGANLKITEDGNELCLNMCSLPHGEVLKFQALMREAVDRVNQRKHREREAGG